MTAPTQKVTWVVEPSVGGGDRVADRDLVVVAADQDFADDEPQDALLSGGVELVEPVGEAAEEPLEGVGELEVGLGVVQFGVEAVELCLQCGLTLAQRRCASAQLVERDQLFLVGLDQPFDSISAWTRSGVSSSRRTSAQTSGSSSSARTGRLVHRLPSGWRQPSWPMHR
jgi:hypothetical protein